MLSDCPDGDGAGSQALREGERFEWEEESRHHRSQVALDRSQVE